MAENLITTAELTAYAPDLDTSAFDATTMSGVIARASERVRAYCNVDGFLAKAVTSERERVHINSQGDLIISFRRRPVSQGAVSAIRFRSVDLNQSLTLTSGSSDIYFIPNPGTYLVYPSNYLISFGRGLMALRSANLMYEIDYTGGYATDVANLPPDLKEAVTLMARDILSAHLRPASGANSFRQGSYSESYGSPGDSGFTKSAQAILDAGGFGRRVP